MILLIAFVLFPIIVTGIVIIFSIPYIGLAGNGFSVEEMYSGSLTFAAKIVHPIYCTAQRTDRHKANCYQSAARARSNPSLCEKAGKEKDFCYTDITKDLCYGRRPRFVRESSTWETERCAESCAMVQDMAIRDSCYTYIADNFSFPGVCAKVEDAAMRDLCFSYVAENAKNPDVCANVENALMRSTCSSNASKDCRYGCEANLTRKYEGL